MECDHCIVPSYVYNVARPSATVLPKCVVPLVGNSQIVIAVSVERSLMLSRFQKNSRLAAHQGNLMCSPRIFKRIKEFQFLGVAKLCKICIEEFYVLMFCIEIFYFWFEIRCF